MALGQLVQARVEPFGPIWVPKHGKNQVAHLGSEVEEYFRRDIELKEGDVVVDVGANVGTFALQVARKQPSLHIVCVEPIPALFQALKRNVESDPALKTSKKTLLQVGLTHQDDVGMVELTYFSRLPCDSTRHIDEKRRQFEQFFAAKGASFRTKAKRRFGRAGNVGGAIVERVVASLPKGRVGRFMSDRVLGAERVRCELVTLDRALDQAGVRDVALLKIDVEGAELDVLRGISDATWKRIRQIVLEGHDENGRRKEIERLFDKHGFSSVFDEPAIAEERGLGNFLAYATRKKS